jgi:uracil-DNA glycosylase
MTVKLEASWKSRLLSEFEKPYFIELSSYIRDEYKRGTVYPHPKHVFRAFDECPFEKVKVVIVGQDPYHGAAQANGLCFAVHDGVPVPPSLQNIFKELESDLGAPVSHDANLERWARQGVLLLNATLTVRAGVAGSHQGKGWETFTDAALHALAHEREHIVFILWGNYARKKGAFIDRTRHCVIESAHPSPLSAHNGFFGSKPFTKTNNQLKTWGLSPIDW